MTGSRCDVVTATEATTDQLGRRRELVYDANSQLVQERTARLLPSRPDPDGTIFYGYDNVGRLTSKKLGEKGTLYTYGYDAKNKLTAAADPTGVQSYQYDKTERLTEVARGDQVFGYTYDAEDRIVNRSYPDGTRIAAGPVRRRSTAVL